MPAKKLANWIPLLLLTLFACTASTDPLLGEWKAVDVSEKGDSMRLDPQEVGFTFLPNGRYQYRSTLRYTEAGTYRRQENFLIARDTTRESSRDRVVAIDLLTSDSLVLLMKEGITERTIILRKE